VLFEDVFDRVSRGRLDTELLEFAQNAGIAPVVLTGQLDDQLADFLLGLGAALFGGVPTRFLLRLLRLANSAAQRVGMHNRDQLA
jgi:hypothetical protein